MPSYHDAAGFDPNATNNFYHVTAVNGQGEGPYCSDFVPSPVPPPTPCVLPGLLVINDINADGSDHDSGQNTPVDGSVNVKQLLCRRAIHKWRRRQTLLHTASRAVDSRLPPPNSQWYIIWNRQGVPGSSDPGDPDDVKYDRAYVAMKTDARVRRPSIRQVRHPDQHLPPPPPDPLANTPKRVGDADSGSYDPVTGVIRIVISNDKLPHV